jgi:hypothetical protein
MEALASSDEVEASLFIDLIKTAPDMSSTLGENARELISFRILESVLTSSLETAKNVSSSSKSKISFELSQRCEDVLGLILTESPGSKVKLSEVDISKYDIEPFLTHKRSCLPKSSLQQIKDSIQRNHPLLARLKENSGLADSDKFESIDPNDETQEIPASTYLNFLSFGKKDGHLQRECPDRKLPDDVTIGQPPVSTQKIEMLEANDNDLQQEIHSTDDEDPRDESGERNQNESAHNTFVPSTPCASGDKADAASSDDNINNEITNIATKKRDFFSSQCTDLNLCIKCNMNGRLLVCSSADCPIVVHKDCLPSTQTLYELKFYFPFCLYSRATSEYMDMKEKVLVARKNFMVFLGTEISGSGTQTKKKKGGKDGDEKHEAKGDVSVDENPSNRQLAIYVPQDGTENCDEGGQKEKEICDDERSGPVNADKNESSEEGSGASDFHVSFRNKENPNTRWSAYLGRRKKLPWTKVEEEKLKEGVEKFSNANENMPWKTIMEFGCDVFQKGRTTIDLKDKWRNLQKKL